ncbi:DUF6302 family protein [Streptomyces fradiae]|uniref:DUF6302 family protein n=1 Tax=Streptomyces fradiae TaxID=1906 RepID=UPI003653143D
MHNPNSARHPVVTATAIGDPQDAYDYDYYVRRLEDTWLVEKSIAVRIMRMPFLAVPVGGARRGGYYPVPCICFGLAVRDLLRDHAGFPDLRLHWSQAPETSDVVEWGEKPPRLWGNDDDTTLGRFYGYSETAIAAFTRRRHPTTPSSVMPEPCSPTAP